MLSFCPECTCPHWEERKFSTADAPTTWQDKDGTWHSGPGREEITRRCLGCGWTQKETRRIGKVVQ